MEVQPEPVRDDSGRIDPSDSRRIIDVLASLSSAVDEAQKLMTEGAELERGPGRADAACSPDR